MSTTQAMDKKTLIKWLVTIVCIAAIVLGLKGSSTVTWNQTLFLATTLFYILLAAFELMPNLLIAILLPSTYLFFNLAPAETIYSSWAINVVWLCISGMIIGNVLATIGLLKRFVFWCVLKLGSNYRNIMLAFFVTSIVFYLITPSGGYIIFAAIVFTFCQSLKLEGTNTGKGLMLSASLSCMVPFMFAPASHGMIAANASVAAEGFSWDYASYFIQTAPMVIPFLAMFLLTPIIFKQDAPIDANVIREQYSELGSMTTAEKKGLIIALLFIASVTTTSIHGVPMQICFMIAVALFYLPGINIGTKEDLTKLNYGLVFFIASFISIGSVAGAVEFTAVISQLAVSLLGDVHSLLLVSIAFFLIAFVFNFLMTPLAMYAALITPLAQVAVALSIPVYPAILAFVIGSGNAILPYEIAKFLIFYAYGLFTFKDFAKYYSINTILQFATLVLIMVPYWKLIGLQ